ncbi:MAG: AmmeMemoRadiSam system radical SAM enzyme [Methanomicrobiales archaeon]|nr:AmmeMemoRadiSam system radical SAM enzyme [Methanomicrobiales archaeon]
MHEARLYQKEQDQSVRCAVCAHRCHIQPGKHGICGIRVNRDGILDAAAYGLISAEAIDPVEKKPLYHYLPTSLSYSLGGVGCNFQCPHCQNWHISRADLSTGLLRPLSPEEGVKRALSGRCASISFTYNEPTIWHEYPLDMGTLARKEGLGTIYVTNGYLTEETLHDLAPMLHAFRVDLKSFTDEFYRKFCKGRLQPVLDATRIARELGMHIETVTLVIPGVNDSLEEMEALITWVRDTLGPQTPMHFTRFHPDFKMTDTVPTPIATLEKIHAKAKELGMRFPYLGNVPGHPAESTYCPVCGTLLIERSGYRTLIRNLKETTCGSCGEKIEIVTNVPPS